MRGRSVSAVAVVVVGAGIAGIACARELAAAGVEVRVLERARVVGGRMASRRLHGRPVDLGAAYFTVSDPEFARVVEGWRAAGLARPWTDSLAVFENGTRGAAPGPMRWAAPDGLRSLVRWWRAEGGATISFGSDAHTPAGLAHAFAEAAAMVEAHGFRPGRHPHDMWRR